MTIKEQVKKLWRKCFNDTEEFIEMFFNLRYSDEVNIVLQSGNQVISALQMIPYPMKFMGEVITTSYIYGACTDPDFRDKGVMKELLSQSFLRMKQKNIPMSALIPAEPWLFEYYKKLGYVCVYAYSKTKVDLSNSFPVMNFRIVSPETFIPEAFNYYNSKQTQRPFYLQHTEKDFKVILEDLFLSGGKYFMVKQREKVTGIALATPEGTNLIINELVADDEDSRAALIHEAVRSFPCSDLFIIEPPVKSLPVENLGMARVIDAKRILDLYAQSHPEVILSIHLTDDILSSNNGYYRIKNGQCVKTETNNRVLCTKMNISELTELVFLNEKHFMSLMLN